MQKALDLMNIKIHDVLSQTVGASSLRMIRAIVNGQRDPEALLALCEVDVVRRKRLTLLRALEGTWDEEYLFSLGQALEAWDFYQGQIGDCDVEIQKMVEKLAAQKPEPPAGEKPTIKKRRANTPQLPKMEE